MGEEYPSLAKTNPKSLETLFLSFDSDGDGTCSFSEFVLGLSKMAAGSVDQKVRVSG